MLTGGATIKLLVFIPQDERVQRAGLHFDISAALNHSLPAPFHANHRAIFHENTGTGTGATSRRVSLSRASGAGLSAGAEVRVGEEILLSFCSNDYLGLAIIRQLSLPSAPVPNAMASCRRIASRHGHSRAITLSRKNWRISSRRRALLFSTATWRISAW